MATDITSKPVPDYSYEVARRNLEDLDKLENQTSGTFQNRAGKVITPIPVVNDRLEELTSSLESLEQEFVAGIASTGYFPVAGSFETGSTITARNQYLQLTTTVGSDLAGGYTWGGAIPEGGLVIPAGSTPSSTGGQSANAWVWRSDATVRSDLANGTADVGGAKASDLAKATINVPNLKALASIPVGERRTDIVYHVMEFDDGTGIGGHDVKWLPLQAWTSDKIGLYWPDVALNGYENNDKETLYTNYGSGIGCWDKVSKSFLIEDFGASTLTVDSSLSIKRASEIAFFVSNINATISSKIQGVVFVGKKLSIDRCNLVFPTTLFRILTVNSFLPSDIVFDIDYEGVSSSNTCKVELAIDGDNVDPSKLLTMCRVDHSQSSNANIIVQTNNCHKGFKVGEFLERAYIESSGYNNVILCDDGSGIGNGGGDENTIFVRGNFCGTFYRNHDQTSSNVICSIEANNPDHGLPAITLKTGKSCSIGGIIRGITGDGVFIDEGSGRNGRVHFNDLQIIQVDGGTALKVDRITGMSGNVYIEKCKNGAIAAEIGLTKESSSLNIYAAEGDTDCGIPVVLGHSSASGSMENTKINLNISYANAAGVALQIDRVLYTNIDAFMCFGNIDITANVSRAKIALQGEFLRNNRQVINAASSGRISIDVQGVLDFATVITPTWYFKGVSFSDVRNIGFDPTNIFELKFNEYVSSNPQFECTSSIKSSTSSLSNAANVINTNFKVQGVILFNTTTGAALAISGNTTTSPFNNVGTGVAAITPV